MLSKGLTVDELPEEKVFLSYVKKYQFQARHQLVEKAKAITQTIVNFNRQRRHFQRMTLDRDMDILIDPTIKRVKKGDTEFAQFANAQISVPINKIKLPPGLKRWKNWQPKKTSNKLKSTLDQISEAHSEESLETSRGEQLNDWKKKILDENKGTSVDRRTIEQQINLKALIHASLLNRTTRAGVEMTPRMCQSLAKRITQMNLPTRMKRASAHKMFQKFNKLATESMENGIQEDPAENLNNFFEKLKAGKIKAKENEDVEHKHTEKQHVKISGLSKAKMAEDC